MHQWKGLHEYYSMGTQKFDFLFRKSSKFEFWLVLKSWNHLSFVNISPTLVNDASIERSSRVVQHGNPKIWIFFFSKKFEIRILIRDEELKSPLLRQCHSYNGNWYINGKVFTSTTELKPKKLIFFSKKFEMDEIEFCPYPKKWNRLGFVDISPTLVIDTSMERSSRVLQHGNTKILI